MGTLRKVIERTWSIIVIFFVVLLFIGILIAIFDGVFELAAQSDDGWIGTEWWAMRYGVSSSQVHMNPKPHDCDFFYAPLGLKGCSYKARVIAYYDAREDGRASSTAKPIVSSVSVWWVKISD